MAIPPWILDLGRLSRLEAISYRYPELWNTEALVPVDTRHIPPFYRPPRPDPPDPLQAVPQLIQAVQALEFSQRLDGPLREQAETSAKASIAAIIDDWCGTPPRKVPWPWPGPPPWVWEIAADLNLFANALSDGGLKEALVDVARQVVQAHQRQTQRAE